jgi:regulator of sigma E protease
LAFGVVVSNILVGLLGLFVMIFVHEFGHLLAAKTLGVKVETFSLGYGKKLIGFRLGETTYQIAVFPFGGFTKFKGEHLFAKAVEENLDRIPEDPDSYYNQPAWKRVLISFAGPFANVVFAAVFFTIVYGVGFNQYDYGNRIILASDLDKVTVGTPAAANPADAAGLKSGDKITAVDGKPVSRFGDLAAALAVAPNRKLTLTVARADGSVARVEVTPRLNPDTGGGIIGISYDAEPVVAAIDPRVAADNSWLKPGDRITEAAGKPVASRLDLVLACLGRPVSLPVTVSRNGKSFNEMFYPNYADNDYPLGLTFATMVFRTPSYTFGQAGEKGLENIGQTVASIGMFFANIPRINVGKSVSGPLRTTYYIGQATIEGFKHSVGEGIIQFLIILCYLSVILAVMNLLPLGIMDGGFIVLFLIEAIRRKPYRPRFLYAFQIVGFVVLVLIGVFVVVNDFMQRW